MNKNNIFKIEVSTQFSDWWRYNVVLMCGCFDENAERIGFVTAESHIASVGANLVQKPDGEDSKRNIELSTIECNSGILYLYIIPHSLPMQRDVADNKPFNIELSVTCGDKKQTSDKYSINQWSGASIILELKRV